MKHKHLGFTIMELLGVILILSLLVIILYPTVNDVLFKTKNKTIDINKSEIKEAVTLFTTDVIYNQMNESTFMLLGLDGTNENEKTYVNAMKKLCSSEFSDDNCTLFTTTVEDLRKYNYLDNSLCYCNGDLTIKIDDNDNPVVMFGDNFSCEESKKCENYNPSCKITADNRESTEKDITLTVNSTILSDNDNYTYKWLDGNKGKTRKVNSNGKYQVRVTDKQGNSTTCEYEVNNINLKCNITSNKTYWTNNDVKLTVSSKLSGVSFKWIGDNSTSKEKTVSANGIYQAEVKDSSGKTKTCEIDVKNIDKTPPYCSDFTGMSTTWKADSRTIEYACQDEGGSGCKEANGSITIDSGSDYVTVSTLNFQIQDKAGNTSNCSKTVNSYVYDSNIYETKYTCNDSNSGTVIIHQLAVPTNCGGEETTAVNINHQLLLKKQVLKYTGKMCNVNYSNYISNRSKIIYDETKSIESSELTIDKNCLSGTPNSLCGNCDKEVVPSCSISQTNKTSSSLTLTINANTPNNTYSFDGINYSSTNTKTITKDDDYTGYVKTNDGRNYSCSINIKGLDSEKPTCTLAVDKTNHKIVANYNDNVTIKDKIKHGFNKNYTGETYIPINISTANYSYYVKDEAGNEGSCSISISIGDTKCNSCIGTGCQHYSIAAGSLGDLREECRVEGKYAKITVPTIADFYCCTGNGNPHGNFTTVEKFYGYNESFKVDGNYYFCVENSKTSGCAFPSREVQNYTYTPSNGSCESGYTCQSYSCSNSGYTFYDNSHCYN